jgi:hypothetical protein
MRRLLALFVLVGLILSAGCGGGPKVIAPATVPALPKGGPGAVKGPSGQTSKGNTAAPTLSP